ncbi:hypothetical protein HZS_821 [Henneguya salminicola]|nr:hypothetical protein HZS_821 [Henneguya salminicola]
MGIAKLCESMSRFAESNKYITTGDHIPSICWPFFPQNNPRQYACVYLHKAGCHVIYVEKTWKVSCTFSINLIQILRHDDLISLLINYSFLPSDSVIGVNKKYPFLSKKEIATWTYLY